VHHHLMMWGGSAKENIYPQRLKTEAGHVRPASVFSRFLRQGIHTAIAGNLADPGSFVFQSGLCCYLLFVTLFLHRSCRFYPSLVSRFTSINGDRLNHLKRLRAPLQALPSLFVL
jgi:hypothetical protein